MQHVKRRLAPVILALLAIPAACSGKTVSTTTMPITTNAEADEVRVTAVDYGYAGLPGSVTAGTRLAMVNNSDSEAHELVAIRLPGDEDRSVGELVQLPPEELAAFFPGVATVIVAAPGEEGVAVEGDGVLTEPGRYAIICIIPTGADPQEYLTAAAASEGGPPDVAGGPPHIVNGMYAELTVTE